MSEQQEPRRPECAALEGELSAYLLGELESPRHAELEAHTESCVDCREELDVLRATVKAVTEAAAARPFPQGEVLEPLRRQALLQAAARAPAPSRTRAYWFASLAAAAAVVACVVSVIVLQTERARRDGLEVAKVTTGAAARLGEVSATAEAWVRRSAVEDGAFKKRTAEGLDEGRGRLLGRAAGPSPTTSFAPSPSPPSASSAAAGTTDGRRRARDREYKYQELLVHGRGPEVAPGGSRSPDGYGLDAKGVVTRSLRRPQVSGQPVPAGEARRLVAARGFEKKLAETQLHKLHFGRPARPDTLSTGLPALTPSAGAEERGGVAEQLRELYSRGLGEPQSQRGEELELAERAFFVAKSSSRNGPRESTAESKPAAPAPLDEPAPRPDGAAKDVAAAAEAADRGALVAEAEEERKDTAPVAPAAPDPRKLIDDILSQLDRRPRETPDMMLFRYWGDNPFVETANDALSTFAVDVDTASYTLMRSYLRKRGVLPPPEAIRTEEFVNYFRSELPPPAKDEAAFAIHTELAPSPFAHEPAYRLLKVVIKGREVSREERKPAALVAVVDTSGSMKRENRIELVKDSLRILVDELGEGDSLGIVAFDATARKVLDPTPALEREPIFDAIATLHPNRNTNVHAGLSMGYELAAQGFLERGSNRVLLFSDGVANTSITDPNRMLDDVRTRRRKGVFLTCVGVGMGNHNDHLLEQLADNGDGQCVYVDRLEEARKVFTDDFTSTLETIAREVKIQVQFQADEVIRYRLLGYENRALADAAFRDNTVDAGEVGAGHEVAALYELKLKPEAQGALATVRVRYTTVEEGETIELERAVDAAAAKDDFASATPRFQLAALVAEFAEVLRSSYWARGSDLKRVAGMTRELLGTGPGKLGTDPAVVELVALMERADALVRSREAAGDEVARVVDRIMQNNYERARLGEARSTSTDGDQRHLRELERQQSELRRRLEAVLTQ